MRRVLLLLAFVLPTSLMIAAPSSAAAPCSDGSYNYRQATTGACAWGNVKVRADSYMQLNVVVRDTVADGHCARIEISEARSLMPDATIETYKACGNGTSKPVQDSFAFHAGIPGYLSAWRLRVCAATCTAWKIYDSGFNVG